MKRSCNTWAGRVVVEYRETKWFSADLVAPWRAGKVVWTEAIGQKVVSFIYTII